MSLLARLDAAEDRRQRAKDVVAALESWIANDAPPFAVEDGPQAGRAIVWSHGGPVANDVGLALLLIRELSERPA